MEKWYVLTALKNELRAKAEIEQEMERRQQAGLAPWEIFLPVKQRLEGSGTYRRRVAKPLIPNLVFVRAELTDLYVFKQFRPYINYYRPRILQYNERQCLSVPDQQMRSFILAATALKEDLHIFRPGEIDLQKGDRVRITSGLFNGVEGTLIVEHGNSGGSVVIELNHVAAIRTWHIEPQFIEVLSFADTSKRLYKNLDTLFGLALEGLREANACTRKGNQDIINRLMASRNRLRHLELSKGPTQATLQASLLIAEKLIDGLPDEDFQASLRSLLPRLPVSKREALLAIPTALL